MLGRRAFASAAPGVDEVPTDLPVSFDPDLSEISDGLIHLHRRIPNPTLAPRRPCATADPERGVVPTGGWHHLSGMRINT